MQGSKTPQKTLIVLAGPTAVGKTALALSLAKHFGTDIISADSRQCYQGMAIGTAQPTAEERAQVRHHFIDCFPVQQFITAADFESYALKDLEEIFFRNDYAIVCGGTGLYIKALCEGLDEMPAVLPKVNEQVLRQFETEGIEWLQQELIRLDPDFAQQGEMQNPVRMMRALAFRLSTGKSITEFRSGTTKTRSFRIIKLALDMPRALLYQRINERVDVMMQLGLLEEAKALFPLRKHKNLQTVGYTELFEYLDGNWPLDFAIEKIKQHSRNYAKRQTTWFKKDEQFKFFDTQEKDLLERVLQYVHQSIGNY